MEYPSNRYFGDLEVVQEFYGAMPTGVAISSTGRIFVCFPEWGDQVDYAIGEIKNEELVPYLNIPSLCSIQSVYVDEYDILWILDTGSLNFLQPDLKKTKLIAVDLQTDEIKKTYFFTSDVVTKTSYLNDVRVDYSKNVPYAYITDSSASGIGAIIVLNLNTGRFFRRLDSDVSTSAESNFLAKVEGRYFINEDGSSVTLASDGIALDAKQNKLYYCPLSSRNLYAVNTDDLVNTSLSDIELSKRVESIVQKGASDGMICDKYGNLFFGDYENNAICVFSENKIKTILYSPFIIWPDTLAIHDNYLYIIVNQLNRQARYNKGKDLRQLPYILIRSQLQQ